MLRAEPLFTNLKENLESLPIVLQVMKNCCSEAILVILFKTTTKFLISEGEGVGFICYHLSFHVAKKVDMK